MKKQPTGATLFAGGEGVGIGMRAAGIHHLWGIELRDDIAQVARDNGFSTITADVCEVDPDTLPDVDILHASPPCITASNANQSAEVNEDGLKESAMDIALAQATIRFIEAIRPSVFTMENVYGYRNYQSFKGGSKCEGIVPTLRRLGYAVDWWHLNAASYGVPQTRKRLILIARRDGKQPRKPQATHRDPADVMDGQLSLFEQLPVWNGWLSAIADIVDTLPESKFAKWQEDRLPKELCESLYMMPNGYGEEKGGYMKELEPSFTIAANHGMDKHRAYLVDSLNYKDEQTTRNGNEPSITITAHDSKYPAPLGFIVDCQKNGTAESNNGLRGLTIKEQGEHGFALTGTQNQRPARAYLVGDQERQLSDEDEPAVTVRAGDTGGASPRALMPQGRVVKMTPRALARFQSFPDWYKLSGNNSLDCRVIGNAIPPLLAQRIYESVLAQ